MIAGRDGGKGKQRTRHPRDLRPRDLIKRLQDVHHFREHEIRENELIRRSKECRGAFRLRRRIPCEVGG